MEGKRLLHSIHLKNLLSYGSDGVKLPLEPLNVLIGPNASGKSNLIDAISLLAAAPRNLMAPFREGGTAEDWLWKGSPNNVAANIEVALEYPEEGEKGLRYHIVFSVRNFRLQIEGERLKGRSGTFLLRDPEGKYALTWRGDRFEEIEVELDAQQSLMSEFRDPINHPQLTYMSSQFEEIRVFSGWPRGRDTLLRKPQGASLPDDFLLADGSNLGLILNDLQNRRDTKRLLLEKLRLIYAGIEDVTTKTQGGTIQIFFHEEGLETPVPAARLSDGTLHYLCLLTVLLHPDPPPLICIEEPELGLHPDIIPHIAELLLDAARRTQLIVTTHSETLVSALSAVPESIVVCERDDRGTRLRRLDPEPLKEWLERYRLGELWAMGEIGGNR
jgi:predicted ATPase